MRSVVICGVLLATVASAAEQQSTPELESRRTFIGLAPIALGQGLLAVDGERALGPKLSARLGVRLGAGVFKRGAGEFQGDSSRLSMGVEPGLRYYLTGTALDGLWLGGNVEFSHQRSDSTSDGLTGQVINRDRDWSAGVATLVGYSMVVSRGLTIQAGVGLGASYNSGQLTVRDTSNPPSLQEAHFDNTYWGISERATLALGWAF